MAAKGNPQQEDIESHVLTRCCDPTEGGSLMGAIVCTKCRKNHLLPINKHQAGLSWKCPCGFEANGEKVKIVLEIVI